ncbi:hypothetical protein L7A49_33080, partial [Achromobacter xylosoxidans]|nr:hypothetical protein [Achromobacter xylosoxidans]
STPRARYDGVVAALPVSIPYERYSTHAAHWWLGRALGALIRHAVEFVDVHGPAAAGLDRIFDPGVVTLDGGQDAGVG